MSVYEEEKELRRLTHARMILSWIQCQVSTACSFHTTLVKNKIKNTSRTLKNCCVLRSYLFMKSLTSWHSLQTTGAQVDPACQRCHTTGYGLSGGFETIATSQSLVSVGCENCHGPSQQHAAEPTIRTPYVAKEQCISCHDHENSPEFEYDTYWDEIIHGSP